MQFGSISRESRGAMRGGWLLSIFIAVGMVASGSGFLLYSIHKKDYVQDLLVREANGVALRKLVVENSLDSVASDLSFLSSLSSVQSVIAGGSDAFSQVAEDFYAFSRTHGIYDQIRLFGVDGMELVRVNNNENVPIVVPVADLQNKAKRYYFKDTMETKEGMVFVSPMDLNIENGEIEVPYKPVVRFGVPLRGADKELVGALILNYKADELLGLLRMTGNITTGQSMLVNSSGYWLLAPNAVDQWAFMFPDRKHVRFAERYPKEWGTIHSRESGQLTAGGQLFTFTTLHPLDIHFRSSTGADEAYTPSKGVVSAKRYSWKLISYIPDIKSQGYTRLVAFRIFFTGAMVFLSGALLAWLAVVGVARCKPFASGSDDRDADSPDTDI